MKTSSDIVQFSTEKTYKMPNGKGNYFILKFLKYDKGYYFFQIVNADFENKRKYYSYSISNSDCGKELKLTQLTINQVEEHNL